MLVRALLSISRDVFDVLMPPICSVCGGSVRPRDEVICDACRAGFRGVGLLVCHRCGAPVVRKTKRRCPRCPKEPLYFHSARSAFLYRGSLRDAIHAFKYRRRFELGRVLARAMFVGLPAFSRDRTVRPSEALPAHARQNPGANTRPTPGTNARQNPGANTRPTPGTDAPQNPGADDARQNRGTDTRQNPGADAQPGADEEDAPLPLPEVLVPVPMHFLRRLHRGYNHAEELAREFSALSGVPVRPRWLVRSRHTARQALMPPERRAQNIFGAFTAPQPEALRGLHVGLVDDILTSGYTVNECARVLSEAGAASVQVLTLARA